MRGGRLGRSRPAFKAAVCASSVAVLGACGSTVTAVSNTGGASGLSVQRGGGANSTAGALPGPVASAGAVAPVGPARYGSPSGNAAVAGADAGAGVGARTGSLVGQGVTATTIAVGAMTIANANTFFAGLGVKGDTTIDYRGAQNAIVAYLNAHGGAAGRRLVPIYHTQDVTSSESYSQFAQEACADWTQDHHVFAAVPIFGDNCLAAAHVIVIDDNPLLGDAAQVKALAPYLFAPSGLNYDRKSVAWVTGLAAGHFLDPKGTYGLAYYDVSGMPESVSRSLLPALARHGIKVKQQVEIHFPSSTSDAGSTVAAIQNAQLSFAANGVDHALLYDAGGSLSLYFMQFAADQHYYPHYGLASDSDLQLLVDNVSASELANAVASGWLPSEDEGEAAATSAPAKLCLELMRHAGVAMPDQNTAYEAVTLCDSWFFLAAALNRAPSPTVSGFGAGVRALGTSWTSPRTYSTRFAADLPDGVSAVRFVPYDTACSCWRAVGPTLRFD